MAAIDETVPTARAKVTAKLREIEYRRQHLTERLTETSDDLSEGARLIELCLQPLEDPQELYRRCDDEQRRLLNQALFERFYLDHDEVADTSYASRSPGFISSSAADTATARSRRPRVRPPAQTTEEPSQISGTAPLSCTASTPCSGAWTGHGRGPVF